MIKSFSDRYTCRFNFAWCLRCINQFKFYSSRAPSLFTDRYDATVTLHIILIPTPTLKLNCIQAIVTGLTLLMSRNKSLVLLMFLVLVLLLLIPLYYLGHVHRICTTYILTDPPPPVSCTTIVSMVTGKTALFSLMLHCFFHPKQLSPLISNTNTLSESRCTTYIQVRLS